MKEEGIDCQFERVNGYLFIDPTDTKENLRKEFEATLRMGLPVEWLDHVPGIALENGPCIHFSKQGQFHIMRYLHGLAKAIIGMVEKYIQKRRLCILIKRVPYAMAIQSVPHTCLLQQILPVNNMVAIHTKQFPYRTYVIGAKVPKGEIGHSLWWDTGDQQSKWVTAPYHYVRVESLDDQY